ncbi:MAG: LppX_LprAFG lipoprotein [SAR202 cluster bacterium]|nr:LppX_LprAFG lipoprotein [SAR202 cluster bacterium]
MSRLLTHLATVALGLSSLFVLSCGSGNEQGAASLLPQTTPTLTASPTPTPVPLDPQAILSRSGQVMQRLSSFRFALTHKSGGTEFLPGMIVEEATGDVLNPDGISVSFDGFFGKGYAFRMSMITLGPDFYTTNPLTGKWESADTGVSPLGFFNPTVGISGMMVQVIDVESLDSPERDEYLLGGSLPTEALAPLLGTTLKGETIDVELSISIDKFYLVEAQFTGRVSPRDPEGIVRYITISDFDEPIVIEVPE